MKVRRNNPNDLDELLNTKSAKELESKRNLEEIDKLLGTPSIKEISLAQKFKSNDAVKVRNILNFSRFYFLQFCFFRNFAIFKPAVDAQCPIAKSYILRRLSNPIHRSILVIVLFWIIVLITIRVNMFITKLKTKQKKEKPILIILKLVGHVGKNKYVEFRVKFHVGYMGQISRWNFRVRFQYQSSRVKFLGQNSRSNFKVKFQGSNFRVIFQYQSLGFKFQGQISRSNFNSSIAVQIS